MNLATKTFWALLLAASVAASGGCFKKGSGKGSREKRPDFGDKGDIFDPGGANKPGGDEKPVDDETPDTEDPVMNPEARKILADCFGIPEDEVEPVVGWTDGAKAQEAAKALCAQLAKVKYDKGKVIDKDAVDLD